MNYAILFALAAVLAQSTGTGPVLSASPTMTAVSLTTADPEILAGPKKHVITMPLSTVTPGATTATLSLGGAPMSGCKISFVAALPFWSKSVSLSPCGSSIMFTLPTAYGGGAYGGSWALAPLDTITVEASW